MKITHRIFLLIFSTILFSALFSTQSIAQQSDADVLLAQIYQRGIEVNKYLVSEKYDGVRAVWDGNSFHTRSGRGIIAPTWFTNDLPKIPLDGELWAWSRQV